MVRQHITSASSIRTFKLASDENRENCQRVESIDDSVPQINNETDRLIESK